MRGRHVHWIRLVGGLLWLTFGLLWMLQGAGLLPAGAMSGQRMWIAIGVAVALFGLWLIRLGLRGAG
jgi:hypothetical protein